MRRVSTRASVANPSAVVVAIPAALHVIPAAVCIRVASIGGGCGNGLALCRGNGRVAGRVAGRVVRRGPSQGPSRGPSRRRACARVAWAATVLVVLSSTADGGRAGGSACDLVQNDTTEDPPVGVARIVAMDRVVSTRLAHEGELVIPRRVMEAAISGVQRHCVPIPECGR